MTESRSRSSTDRDSRMILLLDNHDSFTWNLAHVLAVTGEEVQVVRSDAESVEELLARRPRRVVISPCPGRPGDRGVALPLIGACGRAGIPLLGVCLGHQALAVAYGGRIVAAPTLVHGPIIVRESIAILAYLD